MQSRNVLLGAVLVLAGCASDAPAAPTAASPTEAPPAEAADPVRTISEVSCGGPGFPIGILDEPGRAETFDDPAAAVLRHHLANPTADSGWLPDAGWREVARTETEVTYVADAAPVTDPPYAVVTVVREDNGWIVAGWSQCRLQASVGPDLGLASFRVAPDVPLAPGSIEIPVLVTERACNSGRDAQGRIVDPLIVLGDEAVTVTFAVRPVEGDQDCPSNPETPHLLILPEPLGERELLDGSEIPPRDATVCAAIAGCAP